MEILIYICVCVVAVFWFKFLGNKFDKYLHESGLERAEIYLDSRRELYKKSEDE